MSDDEIKAMRHLATNTAFTSFAPSLVRDLADEALARGTETAKLATAVAEDASHIDGLRDEIEELRERVAQLETALQEIARPGYGLEINDTVEYEAKYWHERVLAMREKARAALVAGKGGVHGE